jgi:hypothetical protein
MRLSIVIVALSVGLFAACREGRSAIIADANAEFSGTQGSGGWYYGYYNRTEDLDEGGDGIYDDPEFTRFRGGENSPIGPGNDWYWSYWDLSDAAPWTEITSTTMYPNASKNVEHFAMVRWVSDKDGVAKLTGSFRKMSQQGDGIIGRLYHNGEQIFSQHVTTDQVDFEIMINNMKDNDKFDFAVDYGSDYGGNDAQDDTAYTFFVDLISEGMFGDFNKNKKLDAPDIDDLTSKVAAGTNVAQYDLNADALVDSADIGVWIHDLFNTWIGDADLNGEFNTGDLVSVLASGTYEADVASVWSTGDFNGDGRTNTGDLVGALADGGYEAGPRAAVSAVPEPASALLCVLGVVSLAVVARRQGTSP